MPDDTFYETLAEDREWERANPPKRQAERNADAAADAYERQLDRQGGSR